MATVAGAVRERWENPQGGTDIGQWDTGGAPITRASKTERETQRERERERERERVVGGVENPKSHFANTAFKLKIEKEREREREGGRE